MNALDAAYTLAAAAAAPWWMRKARGDWPARFGHTEALPRQVAGRPRILLHAVSVGEVNAIRGLVPALVERGAEVVVSVGTDTGIKRARELFAGGSGGGGGTHASANGAAPPPAPAAALATVVRYPVDFSRCVRRFLDAVAPDAMGLVELELWPNFVSECRRRGIPVAVVNGRLSERSFRGYRRVRRFIGRAFASLAHAAVQDEAYRERFVAMGVPPERCTVTGSMKWDAAAMADAVPGADELATALGIDHTKTLIVAGSTGPLPKPTAHALFGTLKRSGIVVDGRARGNWPVACGEEALLDAVCPPGVQLLCAPRKPERAEDAAASMPGCTRRTMDGKNGTARTVHGEPGTKRFLLATIGELRAAYSLADVVVVGRSFGDLYGSDPIEPISLGKPTVIGPAVKDFESIVDAFDRAGGIVRTTATDLPRVLRELIDDPARRAELARRGRECIRENQGATRRHAELLMGLVKGRAAVGRSS